MPLSGQAKRDYNNRKYAEKKLREEEFEKLLVTDNSEIPGEILTPKQLHLIFYGYDKDATPESIAADEAKSSKSKKKATEITNWNELKRIRVAGRKGFDGKELTVADWLRTRAALRSDIWLLAKFRGNHFPSRWHDKAHGLLFDVYVKKDNTDLPADYTQDDMNDWLSRQSDCFNRMILYPRGFRKSTSVLIDCVQWILNCPDMIHLFCTSTRKLGKMRIRELKSWFEVSDYNNPTLFQIYFPEFTIPKGLGDAGEYKCPMAHLNLPYPTVSYTSMESSTAGARANNIIFDDAQDEKNYKKVEMRQNVAQTFDAVRELLTFGFTTVVGTRYTDGNLGDNPDGRPEDSLDTRVPDLYGEILLREANADNPNWQILIEPAWRVKSSSYDKKIADYQPEDVHLLMDEGQGTFANLKAKAKQNEPWFRCQQLNEPAAPLEKDSVYINYFTEDNIRAAIEDPSMAPKAFLAKVILGDTALTANRKSDWSVFVAVGLEDRGIKQHPIIHFLDIRFMKASDLVLAQNIADMMSKYQCDAIIENLKQYDTPGSGHDGFKIEVQRQLQIRSVNNRVNWAEPDLQPGAKEIRIRNLARLHELGLLRFVANALYIDEMMHQLITYNGSKKLHRTSRGGRHDDIPDAMSMVQKILPKDLLIAGLEESEEEVERKERIAQLKAQYELIYGTASLNNNSTSSEWLNPQQRDMVQAPEPEIENPIYRSLKSLGQKAGPILGFGRPAKKDGNS